MGETMNAWQEQCAIIILNYNCAALTSRCVQSLRQLYTMIKIVVVDNCSTDQSAELLQKDFVEIKNVAFVQSKQNKGYAAGNNIGLRFVQKHYPAVKYAVIMNPDVTIATQQTMLKLYTALQNNPQVALVTAQTIFNGVLYPNEFGWKHLNRRYMMLGGTLLGKKIAPSMRYSSLKVGSDNLARIDCAQGCFFMARLQAMQEIDYFDEGTFLYGEEVILGKKIQQANYTEGVVVDAFIHHDHTARENSWKHRKNVLSDVHYTVESRKYYIRKFSGESKLFINLACAFLDFDHALKKCFLCFKYRK